MSQVVGVRRTRWVVAAVSVVLVAGAVFAVLRPRGSEWQPASVDQIAATKACTQAAQDKLAPLVTYSGDESRYQISGSEWTVRTSVNHKTKWADNWYDVTCVVSMPAASVVSVQTAAR